MAKHSRDSRYEEEQPGLGICQTFDEPTRYHTVSAHDKNTRSRKDDLLLLLPLLILQASLIHPDPFDGQTALFSGQEPRGCWRIGEQEPAEDEPQKKKTKRWDAHMHGEE